MEFEAPSVWRIASKHTVTFHNLAALGLKRLAAILVDLAEVDAETPMGTRRRLGQSLEKPWLSGAELKVRIQLPPAESPCPMVGVMTDVLKLTLRARHEINARFGRWGSGEMV